MTYIYCKIFFLFCLILGKIIRLGKYCIGMYVNVVIRIYNFDCFDNVYNPWVCFLLITEVYVAGRHPYKHVIYYGIQFYWQFFHYYIFDLTFSPILIM